MTYADWRIDLIAAIVLSLCVLWAGERESATGDAQHFGQRPLAAARPTGAFPPPPIAIPVARIPAAATAPGDAAAEIGWLGSRTALPQPSLRAAFWRAENLYRFTLQLLPAASAGDAASQYYLYLALDQCGMYLRLDAQAALAMTTGMLQALAGRPDDERELWFAEDRRCRAFAGADLGPIEVAMGAERPGAETEYASIWFQRAADGGFPLAMAERALRYAGLPSEERRELLQAAAVEPDPEIWWLVSRHFHGESASAASVEGLAWLIAACRAGLDCTAQARWYRGSDCAAQEQECRPGEAALDHYWYAVPAHERERAWRLSRQIDRDLRRGETGDLPWPTLGSGARAEAGILDGEAASY